jgi:multidrug efflux system outer membrane protein
MQPNSMQPYAVAKTVTVTPDFLRQQMLEKNFSILAELNQVYQTKLQINAARAALLPSLNLGVALYSHGPTFLLSSVSMLLPFLVPSNWFNLRESQYLFDAEKYSYYLLELNLYASTYGVYISILGDMDLRAILNTQYQNLLRIQQDIETRNYFGVASDTDLQQARAQTQLAKSQLAQMDETLVKEIASVRELMALPLAVQLKFENHRIASSKHENESAVRVLNEALVVSPEYAQVSSLIAAGNEGNWAKVFAFMNSSTVSTTGLGGSSANFSSLVQSNSFSLSFGQFPAIALSQAAVDKLRIHQEEIKFQQAQIVESSLGSIREATIQYEEAAKAEAGLNQVLESQIENYNLGLTDLLHVLDTQNSVTQASITRVRSRVDLDSVRINLHRILLSDQFAKIHGCKATQKSVGIGQGFRDFFSARQSQQTIDQLCKATN